MRWKGNPGSRAQADKIMYGVPRTRTCDNKFRLNFAEVEPAKEPLGRNILRMDEEYPLSQGKSGSCEQRQSGEGIKSIWR